MPRLAPTALLLALAPLAAAHPGHEHAHPLASAADPLAGPDHVIASLVVAAGVIALFWLALRLRAAFQRR